VYCTVRTRRLQQSIHYTINSHWRNTAG